MWSLIYKDIYHQRKNLMHFTFLASTVAMFFRFVSDGGAGIAFILALTMTINLTLRSAGVDDQSKGLIFLGSLPLKREIIVYSKFIGTLMFTLFGYLYAAGINLLVDTFVTSSTSTEISLLVLAGVGYTLVIQGVFWLFFFQEGYIKALTISRLLFLVPLLLLVIPEPRISLSIISSYRLTSPIIFSLSLVAYFLLMAFSIRIFLRKDLA